MCLSIGFIGLIDNHGVNIELFGVIILARFDPGLGLVINCRTEKKDCVLLSTEI